MRNKIIDILISLDPKYQIGVFFFLLATFIGLYKKLWISFYTRNLKKMGLMDEDSKLKVRGFFLRFLTYRFSFFIKNPPPTDNINIEKVSSFTPRGFEVIEVPKDTGVLEVKLRKDRPLKPYTLSLRKIKKGHLAPGRARGTKKLIQTPWGHGFSAGKTGGGKSVFLKGVAKTFIHQGFDVIFCSTINDQLEVEGVKNVQLTDEAQLDWVLEELERLVSSIEKDPKLEVKTWLILDEYADFISLSKPKDAQKEKKFNALVKRILRLGRKNKFFIIVAGQEIAVEVLQTVGISRGAFIWYCCFKTDSPKAFGNLFGDELPAKSLTQPGVAYFKDDDGQILHIHCPLDVK